MPRKSKDETIELENKSSKKVVDTAKKSPKASKNASAKSKVTSTVTNKARSSSKSNAKKTTSSKTSSKNASKKAEVSSIKPSKTTKSAKTTRATKTSKPAKTSTSSNSKRISKNSVVVTEYYDLPFRYNKTIVKILAQTPKTLFIYWDISDDDRKSYIEQYGDDFFNNSKPYLIVTNKTMNYTFEVEINDFANSWYLHVNDANCEYKVELGRKFIALSSSNLENTENHYHINDYVPITSSNEIEAPNDHILFDKLGNSVFFRNVKTNIIEEKNISSLSFLQNIGRVYNIYDLYQKMYQDELSDDKLGVNLTSSNSSSSFK